MDTKQLEEYGGQICLYLQLFKEASGGTPALPSEKSLEHWAMEYGLEKRMLEAVFQALEMENLYKEKVEPKGFRKYLPVMKTAEVEGRCYTMTYIRQYENASIVLLLEDWDEPDDGATASLIGRHNRGFSLKIHDGYETRFDGGSGGSGVHRHKYIVSPSLPDDLSGLSFQFIETENPFSGNPSGRKIIFNMQ